ncbi:MAG TPA: MlaD family protein [Syntrophorhabdaceae bacterium]|nr:MlaD family protein [Syntrophorhabdaceae bacterium]
MLKKKNYFTVGLFVLVGIACGVVIIIWLGASQYWQKGKTYVTYFDESVQGLQIDSSVKYRGVDIGIVDRIRVAPDYRLIEVVMRIREIANLENTATARLKAAGITGIVYVELDHRRPEDMARAPKFSFAPEYPVIPSNPSDINEIFTGVDSVIQQMKQIDFKGISDQIKSTAVNINTVVGSEHTQRIISNLDAMTTHLERVSNQLNALISDGRLDTVLNDTQESVKEAKAVIRKVKEEVNALNLADTADKANRLIDSASEKTRIISTELVRTGENLRRASENLEELLARLKSDPSEILFSEPPAKKR